MATYSFDDIPLDEGDMGVEWIEGVGFRPKDPTDELCGQIVGENECTYDQCSGKYTLKLIPELYESEIIDLPVYTTGHIPKISSTPYKTPDPWTPPPFIPWIPWDTPTGCCIHVTPDPKHPPTVIPPTVDAPLSLVLMVSTLAAIGIAKWK